MTKVSNKLVVSIPTINSEDISRVYEINEDYPYFEEAVERMIYEREKRGEHFKRTESFINRTRGTRNGVRLYLAKDNSKNAWKKPRSTRTNRQRIQPKVSFLNQKYYSTSDSSILSGRQATLFKNSKAKYQEEGLVPAEMSINR